MRRRQFLQSAVGVAGVAALAGCGVLETESRSVRAPPLVESRPNAVYYPTHVEGMAMVGTATAGDYQFASMYSFPHRFWNVAGVSTSKTSIDAEDDIHLMSTVWDPETGIVLPETGLSVEVNKGGELVSEEVIYPMLSQPMGFHYGGNFELDGNGTYTVEVSVGGMNIRRTGAFRDRFADPANATIEFDYSESNRDDLTYRTLDNAGEPGALDPMDMEMVPNSLAPAEGDLPGEVRGSTTTGDAKLVVTVLDSPPAGVDAGGQYLAVSARTPYTGMIIPAMALSGTLTRDGSEVFAGTLERTLDPNLNYHYGAALGDGTTVESGDTLTLSVETPPQVARHEGYETAFLDMPDAEVQL
jgi:hypothetical protein